MYKGKKIALVIPAYNEEKLIKPTLEHVPKTVDKVYVVDDASKDNMANVIRGIAKKDRRIELIQHKVNHGVGAGIIDGYKKAVDDNYDIAVVIGGDYQMDLAELPRFLEPLINGEADYTKGNRFIYASGIPDVMPFKRVLGNSLLSLIVKLSSGYYRIFDTQDGYTAITADAIKRIDWRRAYKGYGYPGDFLILFNAYGIRVKDVPRKAIYLKGERQSQIKILKYIVKVAPRYTRKFFWRLWTKYILKDFNPLVFFYFWSFILIPLGIIFGIRVLFFAIRGAAPTNETILTALFLLLGIQFLIFAMLFDMQANEKLQP
ncbi:MAG: glycosyltransferase family 2 protein [Nanoarchaeota archaeon]|nr:glycosyltransferase family 2 protein [Nanoarchaeota archaeon]